MIEMRQDPTTRAWILVGRSEGDSGRKETPAGCPFCPGHEAETPPTLATITGPDGAWRVRAFPDKMPVFQVEGDLDREAEGLYDRMRNVGAHEVVVETRQHATTLGQLSAEDIAQVLQLFRQRIQDLKNDLRIRYIQVFKNQGAQAGSLIQHAHSHLVATPVIPRRLEAELRWSKQHYDLKERCLYCDILHQEVTQGTRLVAQQADFVAFCPFAPRFAYEVWIFPAVHRHRFEDLEDRGLAALAAVLRGVLQRVERKAPDYHMVCTPRPTRSHHRSGVSCGRACTTTSTGTSKCCRGGWAWRVCIGRKNFTSTPSRPRRRRGSYGRCRWANLMGRPESAISECVLNPSMPAPCERRSA